MDSFFTPTSVLIFGEGPYCSCGPVSYLNVPAHLQIIWSQSHDDQIAKEHRLISICEGACFTVEVFKENVLLIRLVQAHLHLSQFIITRVWTIAVAAVVFEAPL